MNNPNEKPGQNQDQQEKQQQRQDQQKQDKDQIPQGGPSDNGPMTAPDADE